MIKHYHGKGWEAEVLVEVLDPERGTVATAAPLRIENTIRDRR